MYEHVLYSYLYVIISIPKKITTNKVRKWNCMYYVLYANALSIKTYCKFFEQHSEQHAFLYRNNNIHK